ncbi:MAG: sodium:solute symporter [Bacteroidota bacterium]
MSLSIPVFDLIIIVLYLVGIVVLGIYASRDMRSTASGYFLAGRSLKWPVIGAALFASNISTIHLVGLAASGYNEGLAWGNYEWMATFVLILLALIFAPFYFKNKISTVPEFLEKRYSSSARSFLAFMGIIGALFIHIGMSIYAGAAVFEQFFGINVYVSILIISLLTAIYTIFGGLKAVVVTETIQTVLLLLGSVIITIFAIYALGDHGITSFAEFKAQLKPKQLSMIHTDNSQGLAWYAVLLGYPVLGVWYWCTDQTIVQRVLGAETERDAQFGPLFAGLLKILPLFFLVLPGVIAYVLFKDQIGTDANSTLPVLITELIPTGLKGLISAGLLAALMSTIAASLNSCGTLIAVDIVGRMRPQTSESDLLRIGKISAVIVMLLAMAWSTQAGRYTSIFEAINAIAASLAPGITTVFLFGVFWRRGTKEAAISTLIFGFSMGVLIFLFDLPVIGTERVLTDVWGIGLLMQAWWSFLICVVFYIIVSFLTPKPSAESLEGMIWDKPSEIFIPDLSRGLKDPRMLAIGLLGLMLLLYVLIG